MGFRSSSADIERGWAALDERSARRVQERQAWADEAEKRYQQRMSDVRERAHIARQAYMEQRKQMSEEAQMINTMLDALCDLDPNELKSKSQPSTSKRRVRLGPTQD